LDAGLAAVAAALLAHGFGVVLFQLGFVLVLIAALRLSLRRFLIRATAMGAVAAASLIRAVAMGDMIPAELWELPGFGLALVVAFVYSAERDRRAKAVDRARTRLIATVSHDMRNPLTAAMGMAEILNEPTQAIDPKDVASFATTITHAVEEALHLVEDLTTNSRIEAGALSIETRPADLVSVATEVAAHHSATGATILMEVDGAPGRCLADEMRVRQVIRNLISNAQRYGGPTISIRVGRHGSMGTVQVTDDGDGVTPEEAEAIFEPYVQAGTDPKPPESTGLGLANAREIARMMGGDLTYTRVHDTTVFEVTVPALVEAETDDRHLGTAVDAS